jgi:hypothetical protein
MGEAGQDENDKTATVVRKDCGSLMWIASQTGESSAFLFLI